MTFRRDADAQEALSSRGTRGAYNKSPSQAMTVKPAPAKNVAAGPIVCHR
jgi:hypothetical protein